jgi:hypothetical protein
LITAYVPELPLAVGCAIGVNVGIGSGTAVSPAAGVLSGGSGELRYSVGVTVAGGGNGVLSASDCVQAARIRSNAKTGRDFAFICFSF